MLTFVGIPVFFIELTVGQYVGGGPITVWSAIAPIFQGVMRNLGTNTIILRFKNARLRLLPHLELDIMTEL